ncbi:membrane protein, partial [Enterococcus hirae 67-03-C5]
GRAALMDTMGDLFTNTIGALVMGIFAWTQGRNNRDYFENYRLKILK